MSTQNKAPAKGAPTKPYASANNQHEPRPGAQPLAFITSSQLKAIILPPPDWLVENWIQRGLVHSIVAQSGVGKSWVALYLLRLFSTGGMFAGKYRVKQLRAGYIDLEDTTPMLRARWLALEQGMGALPADAIEPLLVSDVGSIDITSEIWRERIRASAALVDVLIIDSLSKAHAFDENSADMKAVMDVFINIARETRCTLELLHHAGWSPTGTSKTMHGRGSSTIRDNVQSELFMARDDKSPNVRLVLTKCKGAPSGNHVQLCSMAIKQTEGGGIELSFEDASDTTPGQLRRQAIYKLLRERGPMGYTELRDAVRAATGSGSTMVEDEIGDMKRNLLIIQLKDKGPYQLP